METLKDKGNEKSGCWNKLKKIWKNIWNSGGSLHDCPEQAKSAQEIRDDALKKCPWYEQ